MGKGSFGPIYKPIPDLEGRVVGRTAVCTLLKVKESPRCI
jgi:hypothetical protein